MSLVIMNGPLTASEARRLGELQQIIQSGMKKFLAVGSALTEIYRCRLWRHTHPNFNAYCMAKLRIGAETARRYVVAAEASGDAAPEGSGLPAPESLSQADALASAPKVLRQPIWNAAVNEAGGRQPPVSRIEELVRRAKAGLTGDSLARMVAAEEGRAIELSGRLKRDDADGELAHFRSRAMESIRQAIRHAEKAGYDEAAEIIRQALRTIRTTRLAA
jgi:hypothetical protein